MAFGVFADAAGIEDAAVHGHVPARRQTRQSIQRRVGEDARALFDLNRAVTGQITSAPGRKELARQLTRWRKAPAAARPEAG